jgi:hypothetical protein
MWRLIKTDILYNRAVFMTLYAIIITASVLNAIWGGLEEHVSRLMLVSVGFLGIVIGSEEIKTKRIRMPVQLPVSIRVNGLLRFPLILFYWISLMGILWLSSLISREGDLSLSYLWFILVKTALILLLVSCMGISQDIPFCFVRNAPGSVLRFLAKACAVCAAFLFFFSTPYEEWPPVLTDFLSKIFISPVGAFGLLVLSFVCVVGSVYVFERRRSYTE